jgi:hypothetical protein
MRAASAPFGTSWRANVPDAEPRDGDRLPYLIAACVVATTAFWAYTRTLLPGVDLGDTGGLQAAAVWRETSAREAYPLYYALAELFAGVLGAADPARGLNLFSAVCGGAATGLLTYITGRLVRSAPAGAAAGLMLAFSHTFWTQAIIAEVYTLHLTMVSICLAALAAYARRPTNRQLTIVLAAYALSFGNHHSMILFLIPFAVFVLYAHPRPRELFRPGIAGLALLAAAGGASVYAGNFLSVWGSIDAAPSWIERLAAFWFDTTKADWRETMILGIPRGRLSDRVAMWWWDAGQQFGVAGLALAAIGTLRLWFSARPWAVLVILSYAICTAFALGYNVGDAHVFFLPGHLLTAFAIGAAAAPFRHSKAPFVLASLTLLYGGWRAWDTWPVVDRQDDRRAEQLVARIARGVTDQRAILLAQLDWQSENAFLYATRHDRRDLAWTRLPDVMNHLPFLVSDNHAIGRDVVLTSQAAEAIVAAYGPLFPIVADDPVPVLSIAEVASRLPRGTPYVMTLLTPVPGDRIDSAELDATIGALTGNQIQQRATGAYRMWAGVVGEPPAEYRATPRPFHETVTLLGDTFSVRMEAWLPADTFRRAGFGRVLRGRQPVLTIERGLSLVWFPAGGSPVTVYAAGLYAITPRFRIPAATEGFARR